MSQIEICNVLKNKMMSGDNRYFSAVDVTKMLMDEKQAGKAIGTLDRDTIKKQLKRLTAWGILKARKIDGATHYMYKKSRLDDINI